MEYGVYFNMCRFLVYWGKKEINASKWILTKENCLLDQSVNDCSERPNPDGWGFAYRHNNKIYLIKNTKPAFDDESYKPTAKKIVADLLFAHVRRRSQGSISIENTHPFRYNNWIFMHNGNIPGFDTFKVELSRKLTVNNFGMKGTTDSEFLFRYFISLFQKGKKSDVYCALNFIYTIIHDVTSLISTENNDMFALNFMLTNGNFILGFRRNRSLYYAIIEEGVLISSEKIDNQYQWNEVPENHFIIAPKPNEIKLAAFDIQLEEIRLSNI